ncbi:hypothetical protein [Shewanella decolorationis]|uniref:Inner membrane protein n=1 Tax=Shewanella decolorationis S12 TaxID=1353536 RepID=A0ABN0PJL6_9GAMM|nr:hypothetical protein [Shewanella decolorationis]ESE40185.1 hypothetical protein SHD_3314 [Shewanella decolorationis S12]GLR31230.1 hypothetical protein GCM10007922_07870 [Shewanella decolorationis]
MNHVKLFLFSLCIAASYYALTISAIGIAAAGKIFWWFYPSENFHLYHISQNFVGIGIAALIPAYVVFCYEPRRLWTSVTIVILSSILFQGNINYMPFDPMGLVRFFTTTFIYGDIGSVGVALEIVLMPILWLLTLYYANSGLRMCTGEGLIFKETFMQT